MRYRWRCRRNCGRQYIDLQLHEAAATGGDLRSYLSHQEEQGPGVYCNDNRIVLRLVLRILYIINPVIRKFPFHNYMGMCISTFILNSTHLHLFILL